MSETGQGIIRGLQDALKGRIISTTYKRCTECWYGPKTLNGKCVKCHGRGLIPNEE